MARTNAVALPKAMRAEEWRLMVTSFTIGGLAVSLCRHAKTYQRPDDRHKRH